MLGLDLLEGYVPPMNIIARISLIGALALTSTLADHHKDVWVSLFNGKDLAEWTPKNGLAHYRIEGDTIVGRTTEGSPNSFLCTEKLYGDFELEFEVKVHNNLNSGVQIRSQSKDGDGRVNGPQVEIMASNNTGGESGYVYGEGTKRGWLTTKEHLKRHKVFKDGEWNHYRIVAKDSRIQTWINGQMIEDLTDEPIYETHAKGFIGLQVHGIKQGTGPFDVAWRKIRIKELH